MVLNKITVAAVLLLGCIGKIRAIEAQWMLTMDREHIVARIQILTSKLGQVRQERDEAIRRRQDNAAELDEVVGRLEREILWLRQWLARRDTREAAERSDPEHPPEL